jgi:hypothetical protein
MKHFFTLLFTIIVLTSNAQFKWAISNDGLSSIHSWSIKTDALGNVYTVGNFEGSVDFDPGPATNIHTTSVYNNKNIFIQKLDSNGNLLWVNTYGSNSYYQ